MVRTSFRALATAIGALVLAAPLAAQERGTVDVGGFGSVARFDKALTLDGAYGGGGRLGMYFAPSLSGEFEESEMRASRTLGLNNVNVGILSSRLTAVPIKRGRFSLLVGAGAGIGTETNFLHSYGVNGLLGAKLALTNSAALRVDGVMDWLANNSWKRFASMHVGLSLYRSPTHRAVTQFVTMPGTMTMVQGPDSESAMEQARLRRTAAAYRELRDSLAQPKAVTTRGASSAAALATMEEMINFSTDGSDLTPESKATLDSKVAIFRQNPAMRIVIIGNTDERATDAYNMGLGGRRASAAKAYLVSQGVDPVRIEITTHGERNPLAAGTSTDAEAQNRRDEFRLLISSDYLVKPKP